MGDTLEQKRSIIVDIFDFLPDLVFLLQVPLKVLHFLAQQFIHFKLLLYHSFQLLYIGIDIIVHESYALDGRDQLALLGEQFSVFLDCCHMRCEDFLLLFEHACHFLLEGKKLLFVVTSHGSLHGTDVFTYFLFVLVANDILNFDLLLNLFFLGVGLGWRNGLFDGVSPVFIFVKPAVPHLFCVLYLFYLFNLLDFLGWFSWLWWFFLLHWIDYFWWKFVIGAYFWLQDLFDVLRWRRSLSIGQAFGVCTATLFLFDGFCTFYLLDSVSLALSGSSRLNICLTFRFILLLDVLIYLIIFF